MHAIRFLFPLLALFLLAPAGCGRRPATAEASSTHSAQGNPPPNVREAVPRYVRATGTINAVHAFTVQVPQLAGQNNRVTLVKLVPSGTRVEKGDVLAEFDRTEQMDAALEAQAKFDDLSHQVRQKAAENLSETEKRKLELKQAEADLGRAGIQLKKASILSEIDRLKAEASAEGARARVESLKKIDARRTKAEAAALKVLELQTQRQKVALERAQANAEKLVIRAPIAGMVALQNLWRNGSMGNAQEGDQLYPGQALLKIFDPVRMEVLALVAEPDGAALKPGSTAAVHLDAYPDAIFKAHFESASPVATSAMGSPIKNFAARFRLEQSDPRLLPDLSAAVIIATGEARP